VCSADGRFFASAAKLSWIKIKAADKETTMEPMFAAGRLGLVEQTSLEIQQASLVARQSGNDIVFWIGITQAAVALLIGVIQAGVVGWGIRYMIRMGERREQHHAERHEETMEAFRLQTTASREQHVETLEALRQQVDALRQQGDALRTLIERTAPSRAS